MSIHLYVISEFFHILIPGLMMKTICWIASSLLCVIHIHAAPLVSESFFTGGTDEYTAGALNNQNPSAGGTGWTSTWGPVTAGTRFVEAQAGDLALYSDGTDTITRAQTGGTAGSTVISGASGNAASRRAFTQQTSGDLYFSFLYSGGGFGNENTSYGLGSDADSAFNSAYMIGRDATDDTVVLRYNNNAQTFDTGVSSATASFFVGRITNLGTADTTTSTFEVWVNPSQLNDLANEAADGSIIISGTSLGANHFYYRYFGADVGDQLDEIRVGDSFFDVTGVTQIPEPSSVIMVLCGFGLVLAMRRVRRG